VRRAWPGDDPACTSKDPRARASGHGSRREVEITVSGEANDYLGKGASGGVVVVRHPADASFAAEENVIAATPSSTALPAGRVLSPGVWSARRFAVRNSGASAVAEGRRRPQLRVHDRRLCRCPGADRAHFAAGMSGGVAFVLDPDGTFRSSMQHRHGRPRGGRGPRRRAPAGARRGSTGGGQGRRGRQPC